MRAEPRPAPRIGLIWAQARGAVIGRKGGLPWHLPEDLGHFRRVTQDHPVLMGRRTWESLPERFRPLPRRRNLVLSRGPLVATGAAVARDIDAALAMVADADEVWVIGGAQLYAEALPLAERAVVTEIDVDVEGDTYAPPLDATWQLSASDPGADTDEGWHTSSSGLPYRMRWYDRSG